MPASKSPSVDGSTAQSAVTFLLLLAVMIFTPLFRAGATPFAAMVSQLLAVGLLVAVLWAPQRIVMSNAQAIGLLLLALLPALYLVPLPAGVVAGLPGRELYVQAQSYLAAVATDVAGPLAVYPGAAGAAVLALVLPISVFLAVRVLRPAQIDILIAVVIAIAALQALLGLLQYGTLQAGGSPLAVEGASGGSAVGTYANRNHLAGLIEMVLPVALALLFYHLSRLKRDATGPTTVKRGAAAAGTRSGQAVLLYSAVALLLVVGVAFTRSRAGIALTILGILLTTGLFSQQLGRRAALGPAGAILALALAGGIAIGLAPVLDRFSVSGLEGDARWQIFDQTLLGAGALFPLGSGPGTFPAVFPAFQPLELGRFFINRAHNDYLEWFFGLGALGILLPALVLLLYAYQWQRIFMARASGRAFYVQAGCGIGVLLLGLHEFVDYNLATPANQVVLALLLSVFLYPPERMVDLTKSRSRGQRNTPDLVPKTAPLSSATPPADQIDNPFLSR